MKILRQHVSKDLPSDARTVLKTPRLVPVVNRCDGEFVYLGIKSGIMRQSAPLPHLTKISLIINIDGLPLYKSSAVEIWPILGIGDILFIIAL